MLLEKIDIDLQRSAENTISCDMGQDEIKVKANSAL